MDRRIGSHDVAAVQCLVTRREVRDEAACLSHQQHAGGDVPQAQALFPEPVEASGRHPGEVKRVGGKLSNAGFVDKAPAEVIDKERAKLAEAEQAKAKLQEQRDRIATL